MNAKFEYAVVYGSCLTISWGIKVASPSLQTILADARSLKISMDQTRADSTPDHAKWAAFKNFASMYNTIAESYAVLTREADIPIWNLGQIPGFMDILWPQAKSIFDSTYANLIRIINRIELKDKHSDPISVGFSDLLHETIEACASAHYKAGDYRNAVLDSIIAVCDRIRQRTGLDQDGDVLFNNAFSLNNPYLIVSEIETESGKNDQRGFQDMLKGFYRGVRNPKAHSLVHDLDQIKSGQYLVLASLLMRRIIEARRTDRA